MLGRDTSSVFPTEAKKAAAAGSGLAELLGANKKVGRGGEESGSAGLGWVPDALWGMGGLCHVCARCCA